MEQSLLVPDNGYNFPREVISLLNQSGGGLGVATG
jgi:hypothetical protein